VGVYESGHAESGDAGEESFHGETWKGFLRTRDCAPVAGRAPYALPASRRL